VHVQSRNPPPPHTHTQHRQTHTHCGYIPAVLFPTALACATPSIAPLCSADTFAGLAGLGCVLALPVITCEKAGGGGKAHIGMWSCVLIHYFGWCSRLWLSFSIASDHLFAQQEGAGGEGAGGWCGGCRFGLGGSGRGWGSPHCEGVSRHSRQVVI
jgi:hypothetical protein